MFGIPFLSSLNANSWDQIFQNHESQMKQKYRMHNSYVEVSNAYLDEFHFGGFENIKYQRNSAALMTQFPISITQN